MNFTILVVLAGLCLLLASTRKYAVLITGLLLFLYPYPSLGGLALIGIGYLIYQRQRRRNDASTARIDID